MKRLFLLFALCFAACASLDIEPQTDSSDKPYDDDAVDADVDSVEQASCLSPCRRIPHKIFMTADLIPGWGPSDVGGGANTGVYSSGYGYSRQTYTMNTIRVQWYQSHNSCVASGAGGTCDGQYIGCPAASQITVSEPGFGQYCGDKYAALGGPGGLCGTGYPNYNWWAPGSAPLSHAWNLASPGQILSDYFQNASVLAAPGGKQVLACNYHVMNGFFWLDTQAP